MGICADRNLGKNSLPIQGMNYAQGNQLTMEVTPVDDVLQLSEKILR